MTEAGLLKVGKESQVQFEPGTNVANTRLRADKRGIEITALVDAEGLAGYDWAVLGP